MASLAQITANRANAQQSTGPRTVEGKARSSRNRLTHGLCGPHTVLPGEDSGEYDQLLGALLEEHKPAGPTEILLVAQLAQAQWKLQRIAAIEADLLARHMQVSCGSESGDSQFEPDVAVAFEKAAVGLAALARHEAAAHRAFDKALNNLWKLQGPRRRDDVQSAAQAELESFIDAYVNAPMPGAFRQPEQVRDHIRNRDAHGAAASANSNPIHDPKSANRMAVE
jgi:hypothetical protein